MDRGVCLIAYGSKSRQLAQRCEESLRQFHHSWPITTVGEFALPGFSGEYSPFQQSRWAKVTLLQWSPFRETLYLDADTLVRGNLQVGFELLDDGWEVVMSPSSNQGTDCLWHVSETERSATWRVYQSREILQLQAGVMWVRKCFATEELFRAWQIEWLVEKQYDQAALLRALHRAPVKLYLLGRPFNGGAVVAHHCGQVSQ